MVFTEFLDFVGERFGEDMVDDIIEVSALPSGGAYTSVGTYSHGEMASLCGALAERTQQPVGELVRDFGDRLSDTFARDFPDFFRRAGNLFDFLESIEAHIHTEVLKLYPDAELPRFTVEERSAARMVMLYTSPRKLGHLSEGLILGSARQFNVEVRVALDELDVNEGMSTRFVIELV